MIAIIALGKRFFSLLPLQFTHFSLMLCQYFLSKQVSVGIIKEFSANVDFVSYRKVPCNVLTFDRAASSFAVVVFSRFSSQLFKLFDL
jgi:hypothetical protein